MRDLERSGQNGRREHPFLASLLCFLSLALFLAAPAEAKLGEATRLELPNGLTLVLKEYRQIPLAHFLLLVPGGGSQEGAEKAGLASLTADLVTKGTARRNAQQVSEEIDFLGGSLSGYATEDYCGLSLEVLSKDIDAGLALFLDCLLHPTFPPEELERQRAQAVAALSQINEDPGTIIGRKFRTLLYGEHPYGHLLSGTRASLASISRGDVEAFYRRFWLPNQAILVAVGDFSASEMAEKLKGLLSAWTRGGDSLRPLAAPSALRGRRVVLIDKPDLTQANILMGNIGVPRNTPRLFPLALANGVLGRMGFSSRLMDEIRANLGLTYHIDSGFTMGKATGTFSIETSTKNENVGKAVAAILDQLKAFREKGITLEELAAVKTYRKGIYYIALQTPSALVSQLADIEFHGFPRDYIDTYQEKIDAVSLEETNAAARDLFPYEDLLILILGKGEQIQGQLSGLGLGDMIVEKFQPE